VTEPVLEGRVAVVTGASRGIGYAAALELARAGAHVVAVARTEGGLTELDDEIRAATGASATLVPLDLKDGDGIDRLGAAIYQRWDKLDILVSAHGELGLITPVAHLEPPTWDRAVAVNMTANFRLLRSFDPLFRRAPAARAVFLTSGAAQEPRAFWGPYGATTAGMQHLVRTYADEVAHTPIRIALLNPGPTRTRMRAAAFPGEDPETLPAPAAIAPLIVELARPDKEPPQGVVSYRAWAGVEAQIS
jgi:NAD(P)-dependent dehydrogenase (short-subunit alcohol dehydrogenase family)